MQAHSNGTSPGSGRSQPVSHRLCSRRPPSLCASGRSNGRSASGSSCHALVCSGRGGAQKGAPGAHGRGHWCAENSTSEKGCFSQQLWKHEPKSASRKQAGLRGVHPKSIECQSGYPPGQAWSTSRPVSQGSLGLVICFRLNMGESPHGPCPSTCPSAIGKSSLASLPPPLRRLKLELSPRGEKLGTFVSISNCQNWASESKGKPANSSVKIACFLENIRDLHGMP